VSSKVIVDTGPLVALFTHQDHFHVWATQEFKRLKSPVHTCEAVLTETLFVLGHGKHSVHSLLESLSRGWLNFDFHLAEQAPEVVRLVRRYENIPMSLADACLIRMAELMPESVILTLDNDFHVYRKHGRQAIPLLLPPKS